MFIYIVFNVLDFLEARGQISKGIFYQEFSYLKLYAKNRPFKVIDCDKNVGLCVIAEEIYNGFVLDQLNNFVNYEYISFDPLDSTIAKIKSDLYELYRSKDLHECIYKKLIPGKNSKLGSFRLLAKLHKDKLGFRPIINCIAHPTSALALLVDCILQPFVKRSASYLQDSQNLIQMTVSKQFPRNSKLYSCDFEGLYTNIDLKHALLSITDFINRNFSSCYISSIGFKAILNLVFNNNVFTFNKKHYKQIRGTAMGSKCGPSVANIYISLLEEKFLVIHRPLFYVRFIDDIFTIVENSFDIQKLVDTFTYLKLNIVTSEKVVLLDLVIKLCVITGELSFSLYTKPTCTFSYLLSQSNHPTFIFNNIPKSLFVRIRRIDSEDSNYLNDGIVLIDHLVARGYDRTSVFKTYSRVFKIERASLISYKNKTQSIKENSRLNNTLFFKLPFDCNINENSLKVAINTASNQLCSANYYSDMKVRIVNNMQNNFSSIFVHNKTMDVSVHHRYSKCLLLSCKICKFSVSSKFLKLKDFYLPCLSYSSCNSLFVVYIIKCLSCDSFYIGQSENLSRRLSAHIRCCKLNLVPESSVCSNLIKHFHNGNCNFEHFSFFVFRNNIVNKFKRLNIETQLIHLFLDLGMKVLNDLIPDRYYWYSNAKLFEILN